MKVKISIIGAGSWGTTLAVCLAKQGINVKLHSVFSDHNLQMLRQRENREFLKGVSFPADLSVEPSLTAALSEKIILVAIPVKFIRKELCKIAATQVDLCDKVFISLSKGIEVKSLSLVSEIIKKELKGVKVAVFSGPTIAREVIKGIPTAAIVAAQDKKVAKMLQKLFNGRFFRVYLHNDIKGVELGGALKNIIALGCGISDGLGFGTNTKAVLVNRGLVEMIRIGSKLGAKANTFWGISGLGDLMTTCFSLHSRNRKVGQAIGKGKKLREVTSKMNMVAEGAETVKSAYRLSKDLKVSMPITEQVYAVLYRNKPALEAVTDLMNRPLKEERL